MIKRLRALRLRAEAGYSLIEMLTVMVIMSIVFAGITAVFVSGSKAQADQDRRFQAQLATRFALDKIRHDIHCASDVTPYATNAVTLTISGCSGGDISWCTVAVSGSTNRYALKRVAGPAANCSTSGTKIADYLTSANAFPAFLHTVGCTCLASLRVDFVISLKGSTVGAYDLADTIFLRNSKRL
ncbi:MAG: type II secretion system GspH family protein [Actinomycetota bacterium]|nr:type II secretion system GspH family protein [Actinomycetota bacterium]